MWVVASPPRWHGPQVRAPEHHECYGAVDVVGPVAPARSRERPWVCRSVHRLAKMASRCRFGALVYTVAPLRAVAGADCAFT